MNCTKLPPMKHTIEITENETGIRVLPNGRILAITNLSPEDVAYLPLNINNFIADWLAGNVTENGREGAIYVIRLVSQFLPDEMQVLRGLKNEPWQD